MTTIALRIPMKVCCPSRIKSCFFFLSTLVLMSCENPQNFDTVTPPELPIGWTSSGIEGQRWITVADSTPDRPSDTAPNSAFVPSFNNQDVSLTGPTITLGNGGSSEISFKHRCKTEGGFDGMILEASINGGTFANIDTIGSFLEGPYSNIAPFLGLNKAWTGESNYVLTRVALPAFAVDTTLRFRFRSVSDSSIPGTGCSLDSLNFIGADLLLTSSESKDPLRINEEITYTVTVKNQGPLPAANVLLVDILPVDFILSSITLSQGIFTSSTAPVLNANLGNLAVGQEAIMTIKGKISTSPTQAAVLQLSQTGPVRSVAAASSSFGPALQPIGTKSSIILANDGTGDLEDGCQAFPAGNIAAGSTVLMRQSSNCSFNQQVKNAEAGGATAAVIYNATNDQLVQMGSAGIPVSIPSVFIGLTDGRFVRNFAGLLQASLDTVSNSIINEAIVSSSVFDTNVNNNFFTDITTVTSVDADLKIRAQTLLSALSSLKLLKPNASSAAIAAQTLAKNNVKTALSALTKLIKTSGSSITLLSGTTTIKSHSSMIKASISSVLKLKSTFAKDKKSATKNIKNLLKAL